VHAVVLDEIGGPLSYRTLPDPEPREDELIVRVRAAGVCGRDLIDRRGGFPMMKLPIVLGHEFSGEVLRIGARVEGFAPGDRVVGLHRPHCGACPSCLQGETVDCERSWQSFGHTIDGGYAELVVASQRALVRLPSEVSFEEGASVACTAGVALRALRHVARLELGERVLVTGASGGVGLCAIQIAKSMGASVVATTGNVEKAEALRKAGADHVVVVQEGKRFDDEVRRLTDGGVGVALELTGSATFDSALRSLRRRGRLVLLGNIRTEKVSLNPGALILYNTSIAGSHLCSHRDLEDCFELMTRRKLRVVVDRTLPLAQAEQAHRLLAERAVTGRVILLPGT
jgi:acryloyl-coenzyme A reductase